MEDDDRRVRCVIPVTICVVFLTTVVICRLSDDDVSPAGRRSTDTLTFLVVVSRHGNRGGGHDYDYDPYPLNSTHFWPYGSSGLTPQGRVQMYNLGVRVRALYDGFLNSTFHPEELHASSTYMDRTLMSGEAFLAGLYPPKGWQLWNSSIPWQPTPIYSDSLDNTPFLMGCQRYLGEVYGGILRYLGDSGRMEVVEELMVIYGTATGRNITDIVELFYLWDKLNCEEAEGYALPAWAALLYPQPLSSIMNDLYLTAFGGTEEIIRLVIGNFYGELSESMLKKSKGTMSEGRRIHYYSGHDSSIVALQMLLGVPQSSLVHLVKTGSALLIELHRDPTTNNYSIQLLYIDGGSKDLAVTSLPLPGCGEPCGLTTLIYNTAKYTNVNYTEECSVDNINSNCTNDIYKKFSSFVLKHTK